jgi:hypothetical protein
MRFVFCFYRHLVNNQVQAPPSRFVREQCQQEHPKGFSDWLEVAYIDLNGLIS